MRAVVNECIGPAIRPAVRGVLAAGLVALGVASLPRAAGAEGKPDKIVVAAYGGIWAESVRKNIVPCFTKKTGVKVEIVNGESADWMVRIRANPAKPPIDIAPLTEADAFRAAKDGLLDKITAAKVPDLSDIPDKFHKPWDDYAVALHFSGLGLLYDKTHIPDPPKTWKEFIENTIAGKYGKRVSMPAGTYGWGPEFLWLVAQQYGGNIDTAFAKMKAASPNVVKFWSTPVEALNLIGTREVDAMVYWDGRSNNFIDKGNNWAAFELPQPYDIAGSAMLTKMKNAPDVAWEYIACALSPEVQAAHAATLLYSASNDKVTYPPALKSKMTPISAVRVPPYAEVLSQFPSWIERWNKEMR